MKKLVALSLVTLMSTAFADTVVQMSTVLDKGVGVNVGQITISESKYGLVFTPSLQGLIPGLHGFHLHQNASCEPKEKDGKIIAAGSAGGHFDPATTNLHGTPWGEGHLGDLPPLFVGENGASTQPVLAPRLKFSDLSGHALIVHAGGDNHSDHPAVLGGGGARVSCGIIQ